MLKQSFSCQLVDGGASVQITSSTAKTNTLSGWTKTTCFSIQEYITKHWQRINFFHLECTWDKLLMVGIEIEILNIYAHAAMKLLVLQKPVGAMWACPQKQLATPWQPHQFLKKLPTRHPTYPKTKYVVGCESLCLWYPAEIKSVLVADIFFFKVKNWYDHGRYPRHCCEPEAWLYVFGTGLVQVTLHHDSIDFGVRGSDVEWWNLCMTWNINLSSLGESG